MDYQKHYHEKYRNDPVVQDAVEDKTQDLKNTGDIGEISEAVRSAAYGNFFAYNTYVDMQVAFKLATPDDYSNPTSENKIAYQQLNKHLVKNELIVDKGLSALNRMLVENGVEYAVKDAENYQEQKNFEYDAVMRQFSDTKSEVFLIETPKPNAFQPISQNMEMPMDQVRPR